MTSCVRGRLPSVVEDISAAIESGILGSGVPDDLVLSLLSKAGDYVIKSGKGSGLLIILDELGKLLEYACAQSSKTRCFSVCKI